MKRLVGVLTTASVWMFVGVLSASATAIEDGSLDQLAPERVQKIRFRYYRWPHWVPSEEWTVSAEVDEDGVFICEGKPLTRDTVARMLRAVGSSVRYGEISLEGHFGLTNDRVRAQLSDALSEARKRFGVEPTDTAILDAWGQQARHRITQIVKIGYGMFETGSYPEYLVEIVTSAGDVVLRSSSQQRGALPWSVSFEGRTTTTYSYEVSLALSEFIRACDGTREIPALTHDSGMKDLAARLIEGDIARARARASTDGNRIVAAYERVFNLEYASLPARVAGGEASNRLRFALKRDPRQKVHVPIVFNDTRVVSVPDLKRALAKLRRVQRIPFVSRALLSENCTVTLKHASFGNDRADELVFSIVIRTADGPGEGEGTQLYVAGLRGPVDGPQQYEVRYLYFTRDEGIFSLNNVSVLKETSWSERRDLQIPDGSMCVSSPKGTLTYVDAEQIE